MYTVFNLVQSKVLHKKSKSVIIFLDLKNTKFISITNIKTTHKGGTTMGKRWHENWEGFKEGRWNHTSVNVRDFIQQNYTPYEGDDSFLAGPTEATTKLW